MTTKITEANVSNLKNAAVNWEVKTSSFTAEAGYGYFINSSGGAITATLPATAVVGDTVYLSIITAGNDVTIARNGHNIDGAASNKTMQNDGDMKQLVYANATEGFKTINNILNATFTEATGGTIATSGNYKSHIFTSSGNFVVSGVGNGATVTDGGPAVVDYLVVAGGGGAGTSGNGDGGGGGGGGGFRVSSTTDGGIASPVMSPLITGTGITVTAQTYPITVGAGGAGGAGAPSGYAEGAKGSDSTFSTITSSGGGGGDAANNTATTATNGGSGGGLHQQTTSSTQGSGNVPPVSPSQGNPGGDQSSYSSTPNGGGGGGAGGDGGDGGGNPSGQPASAAKGGDGGIGSYVSDDFFGPVASSYGGPGPVSNTRYFAGGGGGAASPNRGGNQNPGPGGAGGGGAAGNDGQNGTAGTANQGGGGGAGNQQGQSGGTGGSGIVVIRYKYQ